MFAVNRMRVIACLAELQKQPADEVYSRPSLKGINGRGRPAAVLIPLCRVENQLALLLTLRSTLLRSHPGEVSFPGGISMSLSSGSASGALLMEDPIETALRESREELGLSLYSHNTDVWGCLPSITQMNGKNKVTPVLAYLGELDPVADVQPNPDEVQQVFVRSLNYLASNQGTTFYRSYGNAQPFLTEGHALPCFGSNPRIFGITAVIINVILKVLLDNQ